MTPLAGGLTWGYALFVGLVAAQRLVELAWSRRNVARLADPRASETGAAYRAMVIVHTGLVVLPPLEAAARPAPVADGVFWTALGVFLAAQVLRLWTLASLGRAWNARAVVDPGLGVVTAGPYRWIRHPNYLAVLIEFTALPAAGGAWISLLVLHAVHAPVLARRIRGEERELERVPGYADAMRGKGRFLPRP
jgi:methyltransferase